MHRARAARPRGFDSLPSLSDVGTFSFRWIKPFWYFCLKKRYKASLALYRFCKQKYQKWIIHRKLRVPTSEREGKLSNPRGRAARARCMEKIYGNLRKPARLPRARAMQWFPAGHRYSTKFSSRLVARGTQCYGFTVSLGNKNLFISESCSILVFTTVMGSSRHAEAKNDVNNCQGQTTSRENAIRFFKL